MYIVYRVTNTVNGKRYIGQTSYPIEERWYEHVRVAKRGKGSVLHSAIRKYGVEAFEVQVLFTCKDKKSVDLYERGHIQFHHAKSTDNGYNLTDGGDGTKGLVRTVEHRRKLSQAVRGNKNSLGRKWSEEERRNISLHQPHRKITDEQIPEIRAMRSQGCTLRQIANKYNVAQTLISGICRANRRKLVTVNLPVVTQTDENLRRIMSEAQKKLLAEGRHNLLAHNRKPRPRTIPSCGHPDKKHKGHGLCVLCFGASRRAKARAARAANVSDVLPINQ